MEESWRVGIDPQVANVARIYDYYLGGKDHYPADIEAAEKVISVSPYVPLAAKENRYFLRRAVEYLRVTGVRQFLDLGAGLPTQGNVHEVVPGARVVYVDHDPVVKLHADALITDQDNVKTITSDIRAPQDILNHPVVRAAFDWDQPIAVLLFSVLHFVSDDDGAYDIVAQLCDALPAGSWMAISHVTRDGFPQEKTGPIGTVYERSTAQVRFRSKKEVTRFFEGLRLVEPGMVYIPQWRPDGISEGLPPEKVGIFGGVGQILR
ncbi:SAM-dependent methyltransferase [Streptosporangium sp. CA-115845]|uniref:SAM-dependent methyltransferase n=1 Tax=Streptosporangium sp. CA-115845 TaxID=3240071 RepID=UPI003D8CAB0A